MEATSTHRLLGTWRSDKELTLSHWVFSGESTGADHVAKANWFGRLVVRYTAEAVHTEFDGDQTACFYRVMTSNPDSIVIVCRTNDRDEERHLHFLNSETYWVQCGSNREYFRREAS